MKIRVKEFKTGQEERDLGEIDFPIIPMRNSIIYLSKDGPIYTMNGMYTTIIDGKVTEQYLEIEEL